ncbi:MAG TPA: hypothetical protein VMU84_20220, partial [Thermoanaerobaculia bacterium]|nr:hypothetical protein [Thermoanaerobaculia bacterium]
VDEWTVGFGSQLTTNAYFRADITHKEWNNFYTTVIDTSTGQVDLTVTDPVAGKIDLGAVDFAEVTNSDFFERTYDALTVQSAWRPWQRVNIGANYTLSKLEGNVTTETAGSGPVSEAQFRYPEYRAFDAHNPSGALPGDQKHKLRAYVTYDQPTPIGTFNISILHRFDSGTPYSAIGTIDTRARAACTGCVANPGYETPPTNVNYYFSDRGAFRWDDIHSTDLGVTYELPISRFRLFAQAKMVNAFNNQGVINGDTTVLTARQAACIQSTGADSGKRCAVFNPFTQTPVQGVHWQLGPNFGKPQTPTANGGLNLIAPNGHFQLPRTYLFSFGARF